MRATAAEAAGAAALGAGVGWDVLRLLALSAASLCAATALLCICSLVKSVLFYLTRISSAQARWLLVHCLLVMGLQTRLCIWLHGCMISPPLQGPKRRSATAEWHAHNNYAFAHTLAYP